MTTVKNACAGPFGAFYEAWIERERVARIVGRLLWGITTAPMFASMREALSRVPVGATIIDVPCGGGVAFRALGTDQRVRYIAVDVDQSMLNRASRRAKELGLEQVELVNADMRLLPLADGSADLCLTYSGLHMIPDPDVALAEMARCLRPDGHIVGSTFLAGGSRRKRLLFAIGERTGHASPPGDATDLERSLARAGFDEIDISGDDAFVLFAGRRS